MTNSKVWIAAVLGLSALLPTQAFSITVDGNLTDWGLNRTGSATDWNPNGALSPTLRSTIEDDQAFWNGANHGGQTYDAEGLYSYLDSTYLYVALVTGLSPANTTYPAGDFAIDFGGDGSFEFGIETLGASAGTAYRVNSWATGQLVNTTTPTNMISGVSTGVGSLIYTTTSFSNMGVNTTDAHYVIEAAIPLSAFTGFSGNFNVSWTMNCGNDVISVANNLPTGGNGGGVPEPATWALLLIGMAALSRQARKATETGFTA